MRAYPRTWSRDTPTSSRSRSSCPISQSRCPSDQQAGHVTHRPTIVSKYSSQGLSQQLSNLRRRRVFKRNILTRLGQLGANISPDRSSLTPQVLIGNFLKHNYPLLYELQHINLLCLYLPKKMVYPQTPNT